MERLAKRSSCESGFSVLKSRSMPAGRGHGSWKVQMFASGVPPSRTDKIGKLDELGNELRLRCLICANPLLSVIWRRDLGNEIPGRLLAINGEFVNLTLCSGHMLHEETYNICNLTYLRVIYHHTDPCVEVHYE